MKLLIQFLFNLLGLKSANGLTENEELLNSESLSVKNNKEYIEEVANGLTENEELLNSESLSVTNNKECIEEVANGLTENEELLDSESFSVTNNKGCIEKVSSPGNTRRLSAGKEIEIPPDISIRTNILNQGKKRSNLSSYDSSNVENSNEKMLSARSSTEDEILKTSSSSLTSSPANSPAGMKKRNAILLTKKKQLGR